MLVNDDKHNGSRHLTNITPADTLLLVIDVQGKLARSMYQAEFMLSNIVNAVKGAQILGIPVLHIEQYPQGLGPTVPEVAELLADQQPLSKTTFDCCGEHTVVREIADQRRRNILVCGIETHICVYQSVKSLLRAGYQVEVIEDAVSSRTQANRELGLARMQVAGARLTSLEMCLFELTADAASPAFKQLLPLVK